MRCPICKKDNSEKYKPFCSKHCADVDLGKWLNESYAVPSEADDSHDEAEIRAAMSKETRH